MSHLTDRNFDDLAARFKRNVYGTLKGRVRLVVLERDFAEFLPQLSDAGNWQILDAGAGQAQFSLGFAAAGHRVVLTDISTSMLAMAQQQICELATPLQHNIRVLHAPIQALATLLPEQNLPVKYDLVICHAVLEWLAEPDLLYQHLQLLLKPGAYLSLIFYNINGLAFKNLLRTNFAKFDIDNFKSFRGSLTPTHPQCPDHVQQCLQKAGFEIVCRSGIRVFHDYILDPEARNNNPEGLLAKELQYSRRTPFWQMARYIHFLAQYRP